MWISKNEFMELVERADRALTTARVMQEQNRVLQVMLDWLRTRTTQLEIERAQLLNSVLGIKVPVPVMEQTEAPNRSIRNALDVLNATVGFEDMGDEQAHKLGIDWNPDGSLKTAEG